MKTMEAFKFRLVPTPEQEALLNRHAGCVRFVWNKALDLQTKRLEAGMPLLAYGDLAKLLTLWRSSEEYGFLANGPSQPQQQTLRNLDRAIWEALDRRNPKRFPRFKRKGEGESLRYPDPLQVTLDLATRDKVSVSALVNSLKGVSSRLIRKKNYPRIQKKLWEGSLWSPSYFAGSCGGAPIAVIRQYIEQQKTPH